MPHHYLFLREPPHLLTTIQEWITSGDSPNVRHDDDGRTLVHLALAHLDVETLFFLADSGADLNALDGDGLAPIHRAIDYDIDVAGQRSAVPTLAWTRLLLMLGADPERRTSSAKSAQDLAGEYGQMPRELHAKAAR